MRQGSRALPERRLGDLVGEAFTLYGRHFWRLVAIAAVVEVPAALARLLPQNSVAWLGVVMAVGVISSVLVYGAVAFAVCQAYLKGKVDLGQSYGRVWWRIVTLVLVALVLGSMLGAFFGVGMAASPERPNLAVAATALSVPVIAIMVYLSMAVPATVIEGQKMEKALVRSWKLVTDHWWRVFGVSLVFGLLALGLSLLVGLPFALVELGLREGPGGVATVVQLLGDVVTGVVAPPLVFVGGTLLYLDLRVRKEGLDLEGLARETALAPPSRPEAALFRPEEEGRP